MFRPRVVPCLLLRNAGLVKTVGFRKPRYIGDPLNAVRIFNEKNADELIFFDTTAARERRCISAEVVGAIGDEAFMPFTVGGGITELEQIRGLLNAGAERVSIATAAFEQADFVAEAARLFASSTIVVTIDYKRRWLRGLEVMIRGGRRPTGIDPVTAARRMEDAGAGELVLNSIDRDGTMAGYDLSTLQAVCEAVSIPVVACGGAGGHADFVAAVREGGAAAVAAGSMFVYHGPRKGILINYPTREELGGRWGGLF